MEASFQTILKEAEVVIIEKKSRFIATARSVKTEDEAKEFIEEIRKKYWDARHHVFAYQIGGKDELQRFSDDGEPQGTGGKPVLAVLSGERIRNCCVVVSRYFGGTLLGTGGLVRAYGKAAKESILAAGIVEVHQYQELSVQVEYPLQGKIQHALLQEGYILWDIIFTDKVEFILLIEDEKREVVEKMLQDISSATAILQYLRRRKGAWVEGEFQELKE